MSTATKKVEKERVEWKLLYQIREASYVLGISPRLTWGFVGTGELRTRRIGARRLVTRESLVQFAKRDHDTPLVGSRKARNKREGKDA